MPVYTLLLGGVVLAAAAVSVWRQGLRPFPLLSALATLLCLSGILSFSATPAPYLSSLGLASLAGFLGSLMILELGIHSRSNWREFASGMVLLSFAFSAHGLVLWHQAGGKTALKAAFTNPDCFSIIPMIGIFYALGLCLASKGFVRFLQIVALLTLSLALLLTASRSGLLGLAVGYGALLFTLASSQSSNSRSTALKLFILPLVLALVLVASGSDLPLVERFYRLAEGSDPVSISSRMDVLKHSYRTVLRSPVVGSGLGCFHLAYQQDRTTLSAGEDYMNVAHNDYVQWFVETGLVGGTTWLALLLFALGKAWRSYQAPTPWVASQVGAICGLSTYMALNFACPVPADLLWIGCVLGLSGALSRLNAKEGPRRWSPAVFPLSASLLGLALWSLDCAGRRGPGNR